MRERMPILRGRERLFFKPPMAHGTGGRRD
jgi:hypothetical protein